MVQKLLKASTQQVETLFGVIYRLMPYVPPEQRIAQIENADYGEAT